MKENTVATKAELERELEDFKKRVINATWDYDGGCDAGKRDFLRELNLIPEEPRKYEILVDVEFPKWLMEDNEDDDGVVDIKSFLMDMFDDYSIKVNVLKLEVSKNQ